MLQQILDMLRASNHTLTLREVAQHLDAPVSAVEPMVAVLVRSGLLSHPGTALPADCGASCGGSCNPTACPFTVGLPTALELRST